MKKVLASFFGLGYLPVAPGTWGSLPPVIVYMALGYLVAGNIVDYWVLPVSQVFLFVFGSWICIAFGPAIVRLTDTPDPQLIVADEVAGQAVTMLLISLVHPANVCSTAALGFVLFRLFDITKPWPCRRLERFVGGWGILMDDWMAGFYAAILSLIIIQIIPTVFG